MAKSKAPAKPAEPAVKPAVAAEPGKDASPLSFILAMLVLTGLGVGAGGLFGLQIAGRVEKAPAAKAEAAPAAPAVKAKLGEGASLRPLTPIVTNLASPERTWVRLEASILLDADAGGDPNVLIANISEDILAFLRTLSLPLVEGASGFQHLREDLNDRVRVRSGGKVRDLVIHTFILE